MPEGSPAASSVVPAEIARFAAMAADWWRPNGPLAPLHRLNPTRLAFIRAHLVAHFGRDGGSVRPFAGLTLLDVGCGGGLVSEPMARLGFDVTGLDATPDNIEIARAHAEAGNLAIDYRAGAVETLVAEERRFDVVLALEVVEHVADPAAFVADLARVLAPGGAVVLSTLNRTARSFALGIVAAEWVLGWVPRGTHDWKKFLRPSELAASVRGAGLKPGIIEGMSFDPLRGTWARSQDLSVNYLMLAAHP
jgi:2-polyprenyl-6-hydroxyphenyl methylase/3-demethylubiquinone-9 3-methyltransferase